MNYLVFLYVDNDCVQLNAVLGEDRPRNSVCAHSLPRQFAWQKIETAPTLLSGTSRDCFAMSCRTAKIPKFMDRLKNHLQNVVNPAAKQQN